jgi:hypothetical protein
MKKFGWLLFCSFFALALHAQREVPQKKMQEIYEQVRTPFKYGLVLAPQTNNYKMDCPRYFATATNGT